VTELKTDTFFIEDKVQTLFQTQAWHKAWLSSWQEYIDQLPNVSLIQNSGVYTVRHMLKGLIPVNSIIPIASQSSVVNSIRSEYWQPPSDDLEWIEQTILRNKSQVLFPDIAIDSVAYKKVVMSAKSNGQTCIVRNPATAYSVNTVEGTFEEYTSKLGSNTRLKLVNRRKRLASMGDISVENMWPDIDGFISCINDFHITRWGKPCFRGINKVMIENLLTLLDEEGHKVELSILKCDGEPVSALLDIVVDSRIYNLQSGFLEGYVKGVSLGTLHFGYNIERAFQSSNIAAYDFMAGNGKNSNYKEKIANQYCELAELTVVKPLWLKCFYKINDWKNRL